MLALGHLHLYKSAHAFKALSASRAAKPTAHRAILTDRSARAQSLEGCTEWAGDFQPGEYWSTDLEFPRDAARAQGNAERVVRRE